ncbi:MAG: ROK family protein [Bacteroidia bacterium]
MNILGIDIGGSGIKGAIVNTETGELLSDRHRIDTPKPATPHDVATVIAEIVNYFKWESTIGCSFPTVVIDGQCKSAGNLGDFWIDVQLDQFFSDYCDGIKFYVANDADLAGIAEMELGAGKDLSGKVMMVTIGTGIGSALFNHGELVTNLEFGRVLHEDGKPIEYFAADSARKRHELKLKDWAKRFNTFLQHTTRITSPNHYIIGGGISKKFDKFSKYLNGEVPISVAEFANNAGIIGAAIYARKNIEKFQIT